MDKLRISSMDSVAVNKDKLLKTLRKNRKSHLIFYIKAIEGYRKQSIKRLEKELVAAKAGKPFRGTTQLKKPESYTSDYDRAIKMLEWCVDDEVNISDTDYDCYVLDNWRWKKDWMTSNTGYTRTK